ncbi:hypothetical protein BSL78_19445 [Apostichopus japonicus]|uniref:Uncharacterized protein n=1 Tax=Stichopus japonicus TaxID=307972 RepID=A0A2G8K6S6_STIJA|nr:hypothetical protein BSL78_19445 [Apostichopus japonicus]
MIKDNSRISPFEAQGGLLNSKQFRHSTPIVSEVEEEEQQGKNSEKEQSKSSSSKSLLTISEQDSIPAEMEKEMSFHLNVPSKEEIQAIGKVPPGRKLPSFPVSSRQVCQRQDKSLCKTKKKNPLRMRIHLPVRLIPKILHKVTDVFNETVYKRPEEHENEPPDPLNLNRERRK